MTALKPAYFFISAALLFALSACGVDTLSDSITRQKDLEREKSTLSSSAYRELEGKYVPESSARSGGQDTDFTVTAEMHVIRVTRDDAQLPQPALVGFFKIHNNATGRDLSYPFYKGKYDAVSGDFSALVPAQNKTEVDVVCHVKEKTLLTCQWITNGISPSFIFSISKVQ